MKKEKLAPEQEILLYEREYMTEDELSDSFAEFIRKKRKEVLSPNGKEGISIQEHADLLGLSKGMYQKILNKQKETQFRDCIIAICVSLSLDVEDTNTALKLYAYMPGLDENCPRDQKIIEVLDGEVDNLISIEAVNERLTRYGFEPLRIINHRNRTEKWEEDPKKPVFPYKMLSKKVQARAEDLIYGDPYDSLSTVYDFSRYYCYAKMLLLDQDSECEYCLSASPTGNYFLEKYPKGADTEIIPFRKAEDSGEFVDCFMELQGMAKSEQQRMEGYLNDTKNYHERIGAGIHNGRIHIFYETYNYRVPEFNEYYMFEYIDGVYRLTVSDRSLFMQKYLTESEYEEHYGIPGQKKSRHYDSIEEIESLLNNPENRRHSDILKLRKFAYKALKPKVEECLEKLRQKKAYVRHLDYIWDDQDRVCEFFGVAEEFRCTLDDEYGDMMTAGIESALFQMKDGSNVEITLQDLYTAFELGFQSFTEICQVKHETGSIESVLK